MIGARGKALVGLLAITAATSANAQAAPNAAQGPAPAPATPVASSPIDLFYVARQQAPIWLKDDAGRAGAQAVANVLRNAAIDGLKDGPERAARVEAATAGNDDKAVSTEWVAYVQALKAPVKGVSYGD